MDDSQLVFFEGPEGRILRGQRCAVPEMKHTLESLAGCLSRVLQPAALCAVDRSHLDYLILTRAVIEDKFYCQALLNSGNLEPEYMVPTLASISVEYIHRNKKAVTMSICYLVPFGVEERENKHEFEFSIPGCVYPIEKGYSGKAGSIEVMFRNGTLHLIQESYRGVGTDTYTVGFSLFPFTVGFTSSSLTVLDCTEATEEIRGFQNGDDDWSDLFV